jgi:hypothetical protein
MHQWFRFSASLLLAALKNTVPYRRLISQLLDAVNKLVHAIVLNTV